MQQKCLLSDLLLATTARKAAGSAANPKHSILKSSRIPNGIAFLVPWDDEDSELGSAIAISKVDKIQ